MRHNTELLWVVNLNVSKDKFSFSYSYQDLVDPFYVPKYLHDNGLWTAVDPNQLETPFRKFVMSPFYARFTKRKQKAI